MYKGEIITPRTEFPLHVGSSSHLDMRDISGLSQPFQRSSHPFHKSQVGPDKLNVTIREIVDFSK